MQRKKTDSEMPHLFLVGVPGLWAFGFASQDAICYSLGLECSPKAHVKGLFLSSWCYWEGGQPLKGGTYLELFGLRGTSLRGIAES